jgi:hypothetical protein
MNNIRKNGLSLVEIILSMGILAMIMLPVFMTFSSGNANIQITESEFRAHTAALELMEQIISLPFNLIKAGSYDAAKIVDGGAFADSPILFRLSENPDLKPFLQVEEVKRGEKIVFKKITVKIAYPSARASGRMRDFTLKTLVANENI